MKDLFEFSDLLDQYAELLTDHQREIACLYVYENFSLFEISERTGISRQGVRDCINKAENTLRHYESVLGLVRKHKTISAAADRISACAEQVEDRTLRTDILQSVGLITETLE